MYIRWNYIEEEMKLKGYSNSKIAKELGISDNSWTRYKKEERDITLKVFCRLLEILDLNFQDVVKDTKLTNKSDNLRKTSENLKMLLEKIELNRRV